MFKIILMWIAFIPVPVINGGLRDKWYKAKVGEFGANVIGFLVLSSIFVLYTYLFFKNEIGNFNSERLLLMGAVWLTMTLIFEFGMGLFAGRSWKHMLEDYNVLKGRLWPLVLAAIFFAPFAVKFLIKN